MTIVRRAERTTTRRDYALWQIFESLKQMIIDGNEGATASRRRRSLRRATGPGRSSTAPCCRAWKRSAAA